MLSAKDRENIALKRFSLISPVLNGQVENQKEYFEAQCVKPIDMPYYGPKVYSPKTLMSWLNDYRRGGLEALKPGYRADKGKSRKVSPEIMDKIREKRAQMPRITSILLYEELVREKVILPEKLSQATFYRFLAANPELAAGKDPENSEEKVLKRFSRQWVNELWQTDIMFGPYLRVGKSKKQTYLFALIDDASRLVTHAQFLFSQNFEAMRVVLKEAILKRGAPKMIYTDNGKVYRSGQFAMLCACLGCSLIHTEPFTPNSKGKIERFFHTVRQRFLTRLDPSRLKGIDELNLRFWQWLEEDYQRKTHSALKMSPLDFFMSQANQVTLFSCPALLEEYFLVRVTRKVNHDATLSVETILYETDQGLANSRVEVRYEPEWLSNPARVLLLYRDGQKVGEARQVNLHDNSKVKRKGPGRPPELSQHEQLKAVNQLKSHASNLPVPAISFANLKNKQKPESLKQGGDS
ncbi:MAG: DDE-type integrase/transposase/recombinase [Desulfotomaculaceae bacterium]|nr:DDE-type integrase/transposase/recombinase [Desulfotomaculaceae bacterium]MDD3653795.1 DDE-type integrase/transposase/recombinase [Desulfotomaculaceae bacterium]